MESGNACPARYENRYAPVDGLMDCEPCLKNVLPVGWDMDDLISYALWYDGADDSSAKEDS